MSKKALLLMMIIISVMDVTAIAIEKDIEISTPWNDRQYLLPIWVIGISIISLIILIFGFFTAISFPIVITLLAINALLISITISRSIS